MNDWKEIAHGYRDFLHDPIRKRMDKVLAHYFKRGGKDSYLFNKWRLRYLDYVKVKYPLIWKDTFD